MPVVIAKKTETELAPQAEVETKKVPAKKTVKTKPKAEPKIANALTATEEQVQLAETILQLEAEIAASDVNEKIAKVKELKAQLMEPLNEGDPELKIKIPGKGEVVITKPATITAIDQEKAHEALGDDYLLIAKAGKGDLDKYLTPEQKNEVYTLSSGDRKVNVKLDK